MTPEKGSPPDPLALLRLVKRGTKFSSNFFKTIRAHLRQSRSSSAFWVELAWWTACVCLLQKPEAARTLAVRSLSVESPSLLIFSVRDASSSSHREQSAHVCLPLLKASEISVESVVILADVSPVWFASGLGRAGAARRQGVGTLLGHAI